MVNIANKATFLRILFSRGYSAQTSPKVASSLSIGQIESCTLPNKLVVATCEKSLLPITRISILYRAGARNESYENLGASHLLRIAGGLSTKKSTAFAITRNIQQIGGNLSVTSDREVVAYTLEVSSDKLDTGLKFLQDLATGPSFKPWEISDSVPRLKYELSAIPSKVRSVELLHKAAYHNGLRNSIFCPTFNIGKLSSETLEHYFSSNCTTNRCAVVGVGVDMRTLSGFAKNLPIESGEGKCIQSKYIGGEIRKDRSGNLAHVAVAGEASPLSSPKDAVAFTILQYAAGVEPLTKRGNNNGALGKVISNAVGDAVCSVNSLNISYTDSGLFGFVISVDARCAGKAIEAGIKALKSGNISAESVKRGKTLLKFAVLNERETGCGTLIDLGYQAVLQGQVSSMEEMLALIDSVSQSDVSNAASKLARSKLSIGAIGNLMTVPYLSDLA